MYKPVYFKEAEFAFCTPGCSFADMDEAFLRKLDAARKHAGVPFLLNSAYRTPKWEIEHGRTGTSSHTKGLAVDICTLSPAIRLSVVSGLIQAGFTRIGIGSTFVHVDLDISKPSCMWLY